MTNGENSGQSSISVQSIGRLEPVSVPSVRTRDGSVRVGDGSVRELI